jgi:hypothetical protein
MANTYEAIATVTVGSGGAANIEFTSIPATYTDLLLKVSLKSDTANASDNCLLRFNGDTASNYSSKRLYGSGSAAASDAPSGTSLSANIVSTNVSNSTSTFNSGEIYIPNYTNNSIAKSISMDGAQERNNTESYLAIHAGLWNNTNAITSILLFPSIGTEWDQYSTATLYGIKNS